MKSKVSRHHPLSSVEKRAAWSLSMIYASRMLGLFMIFPIFSLYADEENDITNSLKDAVCNKLPDIDFVDDRVGRHRLWRITDPAVHRYVSAAMHEKSLPH